MTRSKLLNYWLVWGGHSCPPLFLEAERTNVQFELNDSLYFVNFVPSEGRWYVISPTDTGIQRIPVVSDEMWDIVHFPAELRRIRSG